MSRYSKLGQLSRAGETSLRETGAPATRRQTFRMDD